MGFLLKKSKKDLARRGQAKKGISLTHLRRADKHQPENKALRS
jgi:hypothetical protein